MTTELFSGYGCSIEQRKDRYFIIFDSGGIGSCDMEAEISLADVERAQKSEQDAYEVILAAEQRERVYQKHKDR